MDTTQTDQSVQRARGEWQHLALTTDASKRKVPEKWSGRRFLSIFVCDQHQIGQTNVDVYNASTKRRERRSVEKRLSPSPLTERARDPTNKSKIFLKNQWKFKNFYEGLGGFWWGFPWFLTFPGNFVPLLRIFDRCIPFACHYGIMVVPLPRNSVGFLPFLWLTLLSFSFSKHSVAQNRKTEAKTQTGEKMHTRVWGQRGSLLFHMLLVASSWQIRNGTAQAKKRGKWRKTWLRIAPNRAIDHFFELHQFQPAS